MQSLTESLAPLSIGFPEIIERDYRQRGTSGYWDLLAQKPNNPWRQSLRGPMMHPSSFSLLALLAIMNIPAASVTAAEQDRSQTSDNSCELRPVFIEDFNEETAPNKRIETISSSRIGPARWTAHTPWNGDFGDARFSDPLPGGPFRIKDGILSITASMDNKGHWTSGLIAAADATGAGFGTRYGYFEARMKMPPGPGTWPAFWLAALKPVANSDGNVEIDVVEYYGKFTGSYQTATHVWYKDSQKNKGALNAIHVDDGSLVNDFHRYGVDISPSKLIFFLDGKPVWTQPTPPELDGPMYPLVNLALGSGWPIDQTPNPSTLLVDYVHVYGRGAGPPEGCPPGPPHQ
jgi:Glycosyl hydrolases family 16